MSYGLNKNSIEDAVQGFVEEYLARDLEYTDVMEYLEENYISVDPEDVFEGAVAEIDTALQMWAERGH